jgi:hypothetical protein
VAGGNGGSGLGITVPDGHPDILDAAAENLRHVAGVAARAAQEMRRAAHIDGWQGSASEAFTHTISESATAARIAEQELPHATTALSRLADELRRAKHVAHRELDRARAAEAHRQAAERDAAEADHRAQDAAMIAASLKNVIDAAQQRGDPAHGSRTAHHEATQDATAAASAAAEARSRGEDAARELAEARRVATIAADRYEDACHEAARVLRAVAAAAPGADGKDGPSDWDVLVMLLHIAWNGGPDERHVPVRTIVAGLLNVADTVKYLGEARKASSWARLNPAYAERLLAEALPTLNNSLTAKAMRRLLGKPADAEGLLAWFGDARRATPVFKKIGVVGGVVSTAMDVDALAHDHPRRDPVGFVNDLARTGFDASSTAFLLMPTPLTGGAVVVTGVIWAGSEIYQHRREIGHILDSGRDIASDTGRKIGAQIEDAGDAIGKSLSGVGHAATSWIP